MYTGSCTVGEYTGRCVVGEYTGKRKVEVYREVLGEEYTGRCGVDPHTGIQCEVQREVQARGM